MNSEYYESTIFGQIKRLQLLEQEKSTLLQGLEMTQAAKAWYEDRLKLVHDKQQHVGRSDAQNVKIYKYYAIYCSVSWINHVYFI